MPQLKSNPTLGDFQTYVRELEDERGFATQPLVQKCLLLGEEVGELFKAVRTHEKMSLANDAAPSEVEAEIADVLVLLCSVANKLDIDMEAAFREKEEKNKKRIWG
jgi:NTP pyrophosphatase (non-canonical NTP hydrolase)